MGSSGIFAYPAMPVIRAARHPAPEPVQWSAWRCRHQAAPAAAITGGGDRDPSDSCEAERVEQIRAAAATDVAAIAVLAGIRREQYARYQPLFWRPAADALDKHSAYLASLIGNDKVIALSISPSRRPWRAEEHWR
jgi:hypothetical protein